MKTEEYLEQLDELIEKSWNLPLSGGKCVVEGEVIMEIIDNIRDSMPQELSQAKAIVADRNEIVSSAKREAEVVIKNAEEKARILVSRDEIVRAAETKAQEALNNAAAQANEQVAAATAKANEIMNSANNQAKDLLAKATSQAEEALRRGNEQAELVRNAANTFAERAFRILNDSMSGIEESVSKAYAEYQRAVGKQ